MEIFLTDVHVVFCTVSKAVVFCGSCKSVVLFTGTRTGPCAHLTLVQ
jgi:hypothetical protein